VFLHGDDHELYDKDQQIEEKAYSGALDVPDEFIQTPPQSRPCANRSWQELETNRSFHNNSMLYKQCASYQVARHPAQHGLRLLFLARRRDPPSS
jgi:hypothetical protein